MKAMTSALLILGLASCTLGTEGAQTQKHIIDSVQCIEQNSGAPPTFKRVYWKYWTREGVWSISHREVHEGDTVLVEVSQ